MIRLWFCGGRGVLLVVAIEFSRHWLYTFDQSLLAIRWSRYTSFFVRHDSRHMAAGIMILEISFAATLGFRCD